MWKPPELTEESKYKVWQDLVKRLQPGYWLARLAVFYKIILCDWTYYGNYRLKSYWFADGKIELCLNQISLNI